MAAFAQADLYPAPLYIAYSRAAVLSRPISLEIASF
jgi:hypothetical protein